MLFLKAPYHRGFLLYEKRRTDTTLFRTEFSKIVTVLCKQLGVSHMALAEDIASETFLAAMETWPYRGVPEQPVPWLYTVAKNKVRNYLNRDRVFRGKIAHAPGSSVPVTEAPDIDLSPENISDSQLQMLFAICHPAIPAAAQIGLSLRILCGFGIEEIANALLSNKETINKRLFRAREKLRELNVPVELPDEVAISSRLANVLLTLYLLFNEGYYSESNDAVLREDLCREAMRLTYMLLENKLTDKPEVSALLALMCFHASRFGARKTGSGTMVLYEDQDETMWDNALIEKGARFLHRASQGTRATKYHIEATIAFWHTKKADTAEKWENILQLFDLLLIADPSPVVALNRAYALYRVKGKAEAIEAAESAGAPQNQYYLTFLGELHTGADNKKAIDYFEQALSKAGNSNDRQIILDKLMNLR